MFYFFKKYDRVPQWIQKTSNVNMYFKVDVMVHRMPDVVHVFPLEDVLIVIKDRFAGLLVAKRINEDEWSSIIGAPTLLHKNFYEFFTYEDG